MDFSHVSMPELAAIVAEYLSEQDIQVVLVGGLAVEIYTQNVYLTQDIDMVNTNYQPAAALNDAMAELGFIKKGRVYENPSTPVVVEFPSAPLSVGDELIQSTTHTPVGTRQLPILNVHDVVKDRLAAFIHWQDNSSLIQAVAIMLKHKLAPSEFDDFMDKEGQPDDAELLTLFYHAAGEKPVTSMADLEPVLTSIIIESL